MSDPLGDFAAAIALDPVADEAPREGEPGGPSCHYCQVSDTEALWANPHWRALPRHWSPLPGGVLLVSTAHVDTLAQLPPERQAEFGPIAAAIETAIMALGAAARVHLYRWGDGGAHFHVWFMPRPLGMLEASGAFLPIWEDVLPNVPDEQAVAAAHRVAAALAADG